MDDHTTAERAAFEKEFVLELNFERNVTDSCYLVARTEWMWRAWQRAALPMASPTTPNVAPVAIYQIQGHISKSWLDVSKEAYESTPFERRIVYAGPASTNVAPVASKLTVWYGAIPESNGKSNWTAILHRGDISEGFTIDRSEYPDRVRYDADRVRWLLGEIEKRPFILDYDGDKHSGYAAPASTSADAKAPVAPEGWKLVPIEPTEEMVRAAMDCQDADPCDSKETYFFWSFVAAVNAAPIASALPTKEDQ